jgi:hypothetical protein
MPCACIGACACLASVAISGFLAYHFYDVGYTCYNNKLDVIELVVDDDHLLKMEFD